jgi:Trypsin-like peptidase domain
MNCINSGFVAVLLLCGVGQIGVGSASGQGAPNTSSNWVDAVISNNAKSIVFIRANLRKDQWAEPEITGTGFIISSGGFILTCNHVVPIKGEGQELELKGAVGGRELQQFKLKVVERAPERDLCVLKLPYNPDPWPSIQAVGEPTLNAEIIALGFPKDLDFTPARGWMTSKDGEGGKWGTNANLNEGLSGGPVFDSTRAAVAIVASGRPYAEGLHEVIPIMFAEDLFRRYGSPVLTKRNLALQDSAEQIAQVALKLQELKTKGLEQEAKPEVVEKREKAEAAVSTAETLYNKYVELNQTAPGPSSARERQKLVENLKHVTQQASQTTAKLATAFD